MAIISNLLLNPSLETNATSWTATGSTIVRDTAFAKSGAASLKVTTTGAAVLEGAYSAPRTISTVAAGSKVSAGVWVRAAAGVQLRLSLYSTGTGAVEGATDFTGTGDWQWVKVEGLTVAANQNPYLLVRTRTAAATTFHIDGAIIVAGSTVPGSRDGDSVGWKWEGAAHASTSYGPDGVYLPEAELLLAGTRVDWLDLVPGYEEAAQAQSVVQVTAAGDRYVTVRAARDGRGTLTMHFTQETGYGTPGQRAETLHRSLLSGAPHTLQLREHTPGLAAPVELVPVGAIRRTRLPRSAGAWTVEFDFHRQVTP